jgi:hypothetical protein
MEVGSHSRTREPHAIEQHSGPPQRDGCETTHARAKDEEAGEQVEGHRRRIVGRSLLEQSHSEERHEENGSNHYDTVDDEGHPIERDCLAVREASAISSPMQG